MTTCHQTYAALWRFLAGIDLVPWIEYEGAIDEPLPHLLTDPRAVRSTQVDRLWVRLVDVDRALAGRRYATPLDLVLDVEDSFCPWNTGRYRLQANGDDVACERTHAPAGLQLTSTELGAAFLGGTTLAPLPTESWASDGLRRLSRRTPGLPAVPRPGRLSAYGT
ncbi:sterol carrier protein domain-containing protein [Streptomyces sp. MS1.AVA.3]|uniref:sterol carrier protein domain-containing protein n=1 Tax=Streptomyces decoyicus TaxID=249567 RepID=UPI0030BA4B37